MTNQELATVITSIKVQHLTCYNIYFSKMRIGSLITGFRQREVLKATDLYLQILEYYYGIPESVREDESPITEDEVLEIIGEANNLLLTFQSQYYVK